VAAGNTLNAIMIVCKAPLPRLGETDYEDSNHEQGPHVSGLEQNRDHVSRKTIGFRGWGWGGMGVKEQTISLVPGVLRGKIPIGSPEASGVPEAPRGRGFELDEA